MGAKKHKFSNTQSHLEERASYIIFRPQGKMQMQDSLFKNYQDFKKVTEEH